MPLSAKQVQITENQVTGLVTDLATKQSNVLTSNHILVGNSSNIATDVPISGDISINNTGLVTLGNKYQLAQVASNLFLSINI